MTLLVLTWQYPPDASGGTEVATRELARSLSNRGHHVEIVTTGQSSRVEIECGGSVTVHFIRRRCLRCQTYVSLLTMAFHVCRHTCVDVVHAQALWMGPIALAVRMRRRIPYVVWGRGEDVRRPRLFGGPVRWASLRNASAVIALNTSMGLDLVRHGAQGVRVVGNGADLVGLHTCSRFSARRRLGVPIDGQVVVFVGSLRRSKGTDTLLRSFCIVHESRPHAVLLVVGDGPLEESLRTLAQSTCRPGSVVFTGSVPHEEVGVYLCAADVFTLPSCAEGFPMCVAEAMAVGLPVVCCGVGALTDIVRDRVNGHIVPFGDAEKIASAIGELLDNSNVAAQMGRKNRAWARRHSWGDVADRFAGICAEMAIGTHGIANYAREGLDVSEIHAQ